MSSSVNEVNLEKKFKSLTNTQDSIQTLSLWILHHKAHHKKIVDSWMKVLQKAKITHRLAMFYLANDVIQNGKRKNVPQFGISFAEVLREATLLVRDEKIRPSVERVFNIWEQRGVYESDFIADLKAILANTKVPATAPSKLLGEFKHEAVIEKLRFVAKLEKETASKIATINLSKLNATNAEIVQQLKDRVHGQQFSKDFEDSTKCLEELISCMNKEIREKTDLILKLEQSEIYYDTQRGEAKIVANAYKNFGARVKTLQKKLEELAATFPSPIPSPSVDAPSPTTSDIEMELKLPNEKVEMNELDDLKNAPSPVGSPEGLNLSPKAKDLKTKSPTQTVGNPIPTVSNIFSQEQSCMTSWLDTFAKKKKTAVDTSLNEAKKSDPSSLDSRLSNLLQNIPNLPVGLQNTLLANSQPTSQSQNEVNNKKRKASIDTSINAGSTTPTKDECSGQNTPLQDEDSHSINQTAFFSNLASSTKTHNPKDILKGLTNLINAKGGTPERSSGNITKSSVQNKCQQSDSQTFFTSTQHPVSSPIRTIPVATMTPYKSSFSETANYSGNSSSENNLSFIPSLVPSTPLKGNFTYSGESFSLDEYNPEIESFDVDMDIEPGIVLHDHDVPSPEMLASDTRSPSPVISQPSRLSGRRRSTLITVVPEEKSNFPVSKSSAESVVQDDIKQKRSDWLESSIPPKDESDLTRSKSIDNPIPSADDFPNDQDLRVPFFAAHPSSKEICTPTNGGHPVPPPISNKTAWPMSKIETVQSHRKDVNDGRWFDDGWTDFENDKAQNFLVGYPNCPHVHPPDPFTLDSKRNAHHSNFHGRNNWSQRERSDMNFHSPHGPPHPKRFPFRGRGWSRRQPQY